MSQTNQMAIGSLVMTLLIVTVVLILSLTGIIGGDGGGSGGSFFLWGEKSISFDGKQLTEEIFGQTISSLSEGQQKYLAVKYTNVNPDEPMDPKNWEVDNDYLEIFDVDDSGHPNQAGLVQYIVNKYGPSNLLSVQPGTYTVSVTGTEGNLVFSDLTPCNNLPSGINCNTSLSDGDKVCVTPMGGSEMCSTYDSSSKSWTAITPTEAPAESTSMLRPQHHPKKMFSYKDIVETFTLPPQPSPFLTEGELRDAGLLSPFE